MACWTEKCLAALLLFLCITFEHSFAEEGEISVLMPGVLPETPDTYLCTSVKIEKKDIYIVAFDPKANMTTAHHMLLFACAMPGLKDEYWNCGDMAGGGEGTTLKNGPVCGDGKQEIIYAWAKDAPKLRLPEDVGFHVGYGVGLNRLVLQVHYAIILKDRDTSGLLVLYTTQPQPELAGVYLLGTGGKIPGNRKEVVHLETACELTGRDNIRPFAFRTHTHKLGKVVSGWRVRRSDQDQIGWTNWTLIGKMSPQKPQAFYFVLKKLTVSPGDILAARCTMENPGKKAVYIGPTAEDEMCNFYIMYSKKAPSHDQSDSTSADWQDSCFSNGSLDFWKNFPLRNIPESASSLSNEEVNAYMNAQN